MDPEQERCYASALRILNYRFNSEAELRRKLRAKSFESETIDSTIQRLRDEKWLDDDRFAAAFVRTRQLKRVGPRRIARELGAAGVSQESARRAIGENSDPERTREDAVSLCRKRHAMMVRRKGDEYAASAEGRNKLTIYLLNHGYDGSLIREVIKEVLSESA